MQSFTVCTVQRARPEILNNKTAACGEPEMKKESSRDFDSGGSQLTAATYIDRRTIILGRLCKRRLAAKAQHAANVADILESVKVHVASRTSATLDLPIEGHDYESWWFSVDHESKGLYDAFQSRV